MRDRGDTDLSKVCRDRMKGEDICDNTCGELPELAVNSEPVDIGVYIIDPSDEVLNTD